MAQEEVKYTIPSAGGSGSNVDVTFTTSSTANADGSFTVTAASGTYQTLDANGKVVDSDTITGVAPVGTLQGDNELFISADPTVSPIVTLGGITYSISNAADGDMGTGDINFYDGDGSNAGTTPTDIVPGVDQPIYFEDDVTNNSPSGTVTETAVVCFAAGTLITTARGQVAVERLSAGDMAVTASGEHRPIRWIGQHTIDCRDNRRRADAQPVRISANAFGESCPARDLFLSPGHPVLVGADEDGSGGHLVPIMCLINGTTIERVAVDEVTYWHVELEEHDILLAEGLAAESYIDLGSRPWFNGADDALYDPDMALPGMPGRCRPVAIDGPVVEAERRRLDAVFVTRLAAACAWPNAGADLPLW